MPSKRTWLFVWLAAVVPLLGWWAYGLFDLDEGFYGAITSEMNRRGEWITPYYNGEPWFEKPILLYWLAKPALMLFGTSFGPRLPSILATIATIALIGWFLRRNVSERAAQIGVLAYGTCLLPVAAGRMMLTDPLLVLCLAGTFLTFWESLVGDRRWRIASAGMLGLSVLAKGPVGCALFVLIVAFSYWRMPPLRPAFKGWWFAGTIVFLLVVSTWYVPAYVVHRQVFVQKFLIEQNLDRFTGGDAAHTIGGIVGWLFYIPILFVGALPWIVWAFKPLVGRASTPDAQRPTPTTYLSIWFWVIFGFFTISSAKLPHYVLPCIAPIAMVAAMEIAMLPGRSVLVGPDNGRKVDLTSSPHPALSLGERVRMRRIVVFGCGWSVLLFGFAQWAFTSYYFGIDLLGLRVPGFHAEVRRLSLYVAEHESPGEGIAVFQMGRREKELGTGKPKIQETSHPSILMSLNQTVLETDDFGQILAEHRPMWIITRWNRIGDEQEREAAAARQLLVRVQTPFVQDMYALYKVGETASPGRLDTVHARP